MSSTSGAAASAGGNAGDGSVPTANPIVLEDWMANVLNDKANIRFDGNFWREQVTGNKWDLPIRPGVSPAKKLKPLVRYGTRSSICGVHQRTSETQLGFLTHFIERGEYSHHLYALAEGNHRKVNMSVWLAKDETRGCNLIESCLSVRKDSCKFDIGDPIALHLHSILDTKVHDTDGCTVRLRSQMDLSGYDEVTEAKQVQTSFAKDRFVSSLTAKDFKRTLRFFNYVWCDADGNERDDNATVDFADTLAFCDVFKSYDFATLEGFKAFYDDMALNAIFIYDETKTNSIFRLHDLFGRLLRSLLPVRIHPYDGQHRLALMGLFLTGYLSPNTTIPLKQVEWDRSEYKTFDPKEMQCYKKLCYAVGIPCDQDNKPISDIGVAKVALSNAGDLITDASHLSITSEWTEFFDKLDVLLSENNFVMPYNHDNFWNPSREAETTVAANGMAIHSCIQSLLTRNDRFRPLFVSLSASECNSLEKVEGQLKKSLQICGNIASNSSLMTETREVMQLFRSVGHSQRGRDLFKAFFQLNTSEKPQRTPNMNHHARRFCNGHWLRRNVYSVVEKVHDYWMCRFWLELHLINWLRKTKIPNVQEYPHIKVALDTLRFDPEKMKAHGLKWPSRAELTNVNSTFVKSAIVQWNHKANTLEKKFRTALWSALTEDVLEAIATYGFDPDFYNRPVSSKNKKQCHRDAISQFETEWEAARKEVVKQFTDKGFTDPAPNATPGDRTAENRFKDGMTLRMPHDADAEDNGSLCSDDEEEDEETMSEDEERPKKKKSSRPKGKKYNIYYDVINHLVTKAEGDKGAIRRIYSMLFNNIARDYLNPNNSSDFSQFHFSKTTRKGIENEKKFSMELALHLYVERVTSKVPLWDCSLILLKGLEGPKESLLRGKVPKNRGIAYTERNCGIFDKSYNSLGVCLPKPYRFTTFLELLLSDYIDTDTYESLLSHCLSCDWTRELKIAQRTHRFRDGYNSSDCVGGSNYHGLNEEANFIMKEIRLMMGAKRAPSVRVDNAVQAFGWCLENGLVKSVVLTKDNNLKQLYIDAREKQIAEATVEVNGVPKIGALGDLVAENDTKGEYKLKDVVAGLPKSFEEYKKEKQAEREAKKATKKKNNGKAKTDKSGSPPTINLTASKDSDESPLSIRSPHATTPSNFQSLGHLEKDAFSVKKQLPFAGTEDMELDEYQQKKQETESSALKRKKEQEKNKEDIAKKLRVADEARANQRKAEQEAARKTAAAAKKTPGKENPPNPTQKPSKARPQRGGRGTGGK